MALVTMPLGSFSASGSIAGALVYSTWKGRPYVRRLVKPSNPKSGGQVGVRSMFKFLSQNWDALITADKATWDEAADARTYSPFNAYMSLNQRNWRNFLAPSQKDPPLRSDTPDTVATFTAVAGVRQITIGMTDADVQSNGWGFLLFRALTTGFTPSVSNLIAAVFDVNGDESVFVDTPLVADEYFYDCKVFTVQGTSGTLKGEISATVT